VRHVHPLERHSRQPKVRSATIRKSGRDGNSLTPTEKTRKSKLMRQFRNLESGAAPSKEYVESEAWCPACFGRHLRAPGLSTCHGCAGLEDTEERPYRLTHHGRVEPVILLSEAEAGDPFAD
jgi:hypothetical protein